MKHPADYLNYASEDSTVTSSSSWLHWLLMLKHSARPPDACSVATSNAESYREVTKHCVVFLASFAVLIRDRIQASMH